MIENAVENLVRDSTCEVTWKRGIKETTKPGDSNRTYRPTNGQTLTIEVNGGASRDLGARLGPFGPDPIGSRARKATR
jgi:hypothetical protein